MRRQHILSDNWFIRQIEHDQPLDVGEWTRLAGRGPEWLPAHMPAQVHDVLLAHDHIPDPRVGHNAAACVWVAQTDWVYACRFATPEEVEGPALLRFRGVDTLCTAYLNGEQVGAFDNQFREWVVDVTGRLAPTGQPNVLLMRFASPLRAVEAVRQPAGHVGVVPTFKYVRKSLQDFGSYLGVRPHLAKIGLFDDVVLGSPGLDAVATSGCAIDLEPGHGARYPLGAGRDAGTGPESQRCAGASLNPLGQVGRARRGDPIEGGFNVEVRHPQLGGPHPWPAKPLHPGRRTRAGWRGA